MNDDTQPAPETFHGDPGHSCYSESGELVCVSGKMLIDNGPDWRTLLGECQ